MKTIIFATVILSLLDFNQPSNAQNMNTNNHPAAPGKQSPFEETKDIFPRGTLMSGNPNFTGKAWLEMLVTQEDSLDCTIGNVTFAPGVRNSWHSHPGGQILLCTSGKGYYQEKGKLAQLLRSGDIVKIQPNVVHWHGAAPDSEFTHIAIGPQQSKGEVVWLNAVSDEEYQKLPQ